MSSISTFGAFTTARLGIYVSQKALDVVGNNIANINTVGYTRQSFNQKSMYAGAADRYHTILDARVGNGAIITNVTQLRDPYLDIRYRNENASVGAMEAKLNGLQQLSDILDEVGKGEDESGVLEAAFNNLMTQLQNLNTQGAGVDTFDTQVRSAAQSLVDKFHSYASQLETLAKNQRTGFDQDVTNVNTILRNIRDLNESIRNSNIYGGDALEQKDARNNLIDELSQYMRINVTYEQEDLGEGKTIEKLVIKLDGNDPGDDAGRATLVDGIYATQLSIQQVPVPKLDADGKPVLNGGKPVYETDKNGEIVMQEDPHLRMQLAQLEDNQGRLMRARSTKIETMTDKNAATPGPIVITPAAGKSAQETLDDLVKNDHDTYPTEDHDNTDKSGMYKSYTYKAVEDQPGHWVVQRTTETFSDEVKLDDNTLYGALQAERELMTECGEYATKEQMDMDPNAAIKRGIPYYQKALDTLANEFANIFNKANTFDPAKVKNPNDGTATVMYNDVFKMPDGSYLQLETEEKDGVLYFKNEPAICSLRGEQLRVADDGKLTDLQKQHLLPTKDHLGHAYYKVMERDGPLFSNNGNDNTTDKITASNISIAKDWADGKVRMLQSRDPNHTSTDNSNLSHFLNLMKAQHDFNPNGFDLKTGSHMEEPIPNAATDVKDNVFFTGTFQEMLTENMAATLATDYMTTDNMLDNYTTTSNELYVERDSISGVDLNDEAMNMIQYQKSYNAACRLMTTIDEMLDKLINGTGRAGL